MNLELLALRWLLYEKQCVLALRERSPRAGICGQPDALGITAARYLVEIEIKRTVSDFRADAKKPSRYNRGDQNPNQEWLLKKLPKYFYYMVPASLVDKVLPLLPTWAGLLRGPANHYEGYAAYAVKPAPANHNSTRLTTKECSRLLRMVANWAMSEAESRQNDFNRFRDGYHTYPEPDFEI